MSVPIQEKYFHTAAVAPGEGAEMKTKNGSAVIIEIVSDGVGVAFAGKFQGKVFADSEYGDVECTKLSDGNFADSAVAADGVYMFDIRGLHSIRVNLSAVADGTVTVRGREIS